MKGRIDKKRIEVYLHYLAIAALIIIGSVDIVLAQELTEKEKQLAMTQYTVPYRFDKALKVGDWVKYRIAREGEEIEEIELKVTKQENDGVWIVEQHREGEMQKGFDMHLLVGLKSLKLVKVFAVDEGGEKFEATPLDEATLSQIIEMGKKAKQAEMTDIIGWEKGTEKEKVVVAKSVFECSYLEPKFSEEYIERIEDYGATVIEVKEKSRLYFSEDIPRLLPTQIAFGWIIFIETFEEVKGGFVKSTQMNLELVGYSGQEE
jgi:hypothetical protein